MFYVSLLIVLLLPCIMLLFGWLLASPGTSKGKPNHFFGYRTKKSMYNQDTWEFANMYCGVLWMRWSIPVAVPSLLIFYLFRQQYEAASTIIMLLQLIPLFASIWCTEKALVKTFDQQGNRREEA